jgi:hypothetical protein
MRIAPCSLKSHALRRGLYRDNRVLCRACTAIKQRIAVQEKTDFTGRSEACTAMCRALPHLRTRAGAHVRTQEHNCLRLEMPRYSAAHAVQNLALVFPSATRSTSRRFARVASRRVVRPIGGNDPHPRLCAPRCDWRVGASLAATEGVPAGNRYSPARLPNYGRGNGNQYRLTFFRKKNHDRPFRNGVLHAN